MTTDNTSTYTTSPANVKVGDTVRTARGTDWTVAAVSDDNNRTVLDVWPADGRGYGRVFSYAADDTVTLVGTDPRSDLVDERRALLAFLDFHGDDYSTAADNALARLAAVNALLGWA